MKKLTAEQWTTLVQEYTEGEPVIDLAADYGVSVAYVYQMLNRLRKNGAIIKRPQSDPLVPRIVAAINGKKK